jgi:CDP-diglyceride synthetase
MDKKTWTGIFLGLTAFVIGLEVYAANDNSANTIPWTTYIINHIPYEITFALIIGLSGWLIVHFLRWYGIIEQKK